MGDDHDGFPVTVQWLRELPPLDALQMAGFELRTRLVTASGMLQMIDHGMLGPVPERLQAPVSSSLQAMQEALELVHVIVAERVKELRGSSADDHETVVD